MSKAIGIVGIHTGIGKTITSAVLVEAFKADYWKPVQAGDLNNSDSIQVDCLVTNEKSKVHEEAFRFTRPLSPHKAAKIDGVVLNIDSFELPKTDNLLIIETAGGLHSPMGNDFTMIDFVSHHKLPVILVTKNYLGSINHTLLSVEILQKRNIEVVGIIVNGEEESDSESFITSYSDVPIIARIPKINELIAENIITVANTVKEKLRGLL